VKAARGLLTLLLLGLQLPAGAEPVLTTWVETNPSGNPNQIGLGYPVPIPVDTPLPFDGFRSYAGLHARHQDLAATTPWVHEEEIGTTRNGRTIRAYRLGDNDRETVYGLPEPATLTNGGIHAREWQTPEVVTGILELIATQADDEHFYAYLRDNVNMVVIPSLNIDGFLQTQRYPAQNFLGVDDRYPNTSPRDGRMRRKNMLGADELLISTADLLNGVDLNRNSSPFWNTNPGRSSGNPRSLVYHGIAPASEPETLALDAAAALGPASQLRLYTDVHSFSQVHFWGRSDNLRLAAQTEAVLRTFSTHHASFPAGKWYAFSDVWSTPVNQGIGTTDEYFTHAYQVPSWTLEVEPSGGQSYHASLPGCGADYGGEANNCHDGFILPESEIRRVREELAQSFAAVYYRQAGPPALVALRLVDESTGAVIHEARWDVADTSTRTLFENRLRALRPGRRYQLWLAFDKPMRWREQGSVVAFPGRPNNALDISVELFAGSQELAISVDSAGWNRDGWGAPSGYINYRDDSYTVTFEVIESAENIAALEGIMAATVSVSTADMSDLRLDANPATVASWANGAWTGYESTSGVQADFGGADTSLAIPVSVENVPAPFLLEPGIAAAWYDPARVGEGFVIEMLADGRVVMYWFTYDDDGRQDWYIAVGEVRGNRAMFPEVLRVSGGVFGPSFDPEKIVRQPVGTAAFIWSSCDEGVMEWHVGNRTGRQFLTRLTRVMGLDCGLPLMAPVGLEALYSGSWFDPSHSGEGFVVELLANGQAVVFWFSYGPDGKRRWFLGVGELVDDVLVFEDMYTYRGGIFGEGFDPALIEELPWGRLELELACDGGTARYESTEDGFGSGRLDLIQLTQLEGLECPG
jgi:hypothetical protein